MSSALGNGFSQSDFKISCGFSEQREIYIILSGITFRRVVGEGRLAHLDARIWEALMSATTCRK